MFFEHPHPTSGRWHLRRTKQDAHEYLTVRIDDWLDAEVRRFWDDRGVDPSSGFRRIVEEWWVVQRFSHLEFRDGVSGRRAGITGGPDVWEILLVARDLGRDLDALHEHFAARISRGALREALEYAERFPETVTSMIEANERPEHSP